MLIDWFTVAAQIVNFLVLVWLLKRFLYRRILAAIEARETRIATRLADAEAKEKDAAGQRALYQAKLQEVGQQQQEMLAQSRLEAEKQRAEMLQQAREEVTALESRWKEDLEHEQNAFLAELRNRAAAEILEITRRVVADLACLDVQQCAVLAFLEKIRQMDEDVRRKLAGRDLTIRTAFELSDQIRLQIRQTLEDRLQTPVALEFERAAGLGLGLELRGNGWRVGWNSECYLEALEEALREAFEQTSESNVPVGCA